MALYSPDVVATSFIKQYYEVLANTPSLLFRFYKADSYFSYYPEGAQDCDAAFGIEAIKDTVDKLNFSGARVDLSEGSIDAQKSDNNGVLLLVTGDITIPGNASRLFVQTFFLAAQSNISSSAAPAQISYYVRNSVLRLVGPRIPPSIVTSADIETDTEAPLTTQSSPVSAAVTAAAAIVEDDVDDLAASNGSSKHAIEETTSSVGAAASFEYSATADEIAAVSEAVDTDALGPETTQTPVVRSYRDMLKGNAAAAAASTAVVKPSERPRRVSATSAAVDVAPMNANRSGAARGGEKEKDGKAATQAAKQVFSLYVKQLPAETTEGELRELFGKFGKVSRADPNNLKGYAFVDVDNQAGFDAALAASNTDVLGLRGSKLVTEERNSTRGPSTGSRSRGAGTSRRTPGEEREEKGEQKRERAERGDKADKGGERRTRGGASGGGDKDKENNGRKEGGGGHKDSKDRQERTDKAKTAAAAESSK